MAKSLGEQLAAARKKHGLSLEQTAARIGVSFATIRRWELGKSAPCSDAVRRTVETFLTNLQ